MPELPEVETVVRTLENLVGQTKINHVDILYPKLIDNVSPNEFQERIKNQVIHSYDRIGKYLLFTLDQDVLVVHLRMEGKFYVAKGSDAYDKKHTHAIFYLQDGRQLQYHDTRKFGRMYLYDKHLDRDSYTALKNVGYDVFDENLTSKFLYDESRNKNITLKQFLLDQRYMAGVGNIYADEICFRMKLHPESKVSKLSKKDFERLLEATRIILSGAIKAGGTTIRSYTSSLGVDGRFQLQLKVHQKVDEHCLTCGTIIKKIKVGGRGTYVCTKCQKRK